MHIINLANFGIHSRLCKGMQQSSSTKEDNEVALFYLRVRRRINKFDKRDRSPQNALGGFGCDTENVSEE